ncbi:MAG: sulfite exporter TauE/SafE family protein [Alphaproteobacteria bacterium]
MTLLDVLVYFLAGFIGSAINSVAGGGTFLTFPLLIMNGMGALQANIMSTIALWPGSVASAFAYKNERNVDKQQLTKFIIISILGSIVGTVTLLLTPEQTFESLVPWLLLFATLLFTFGRNFALPQSSTHHGAWLGFLLQFGIAVYGGYFGAGIGILMLAMLQLQGFSNIHQMNALKTILGSTINAVAVLLFLFSGKVIWPVAIVMIAGALTGGYAGAKCALKFSPAKVRMVVCIIGFVMTGYFFAKEF